MAPFNSGSGGTLPGILTLEDWTLAHINFLRIQQNTEARNPNNARNLTITANTAGAISGTFTSPVNVVAGAAGALAITAESYLVGVVYTSPTGGDASAPNEVQALVDAVRRQKALELAGTNRNPSNANYLSLSITMGTTEVSNTNATISLGFSGLPVDMTQAPNGAVTFEGRSYLT